MSEPVKIKLNKEQTILFLSCFTQDAERIIIERKKQLKQQKEQDIEKIAK